MRHASLTELLGIRDGEPVDAAVRDHAERCETCAAEFARLGRIAAGLRDLPVIEPPEERFAAIAATSAPRVRRRPPLVFAIAATAVVATGLAFIIGNYEPAPDSSPRTARADDAPVTGTVPSRLEAAIAKSQAESRLLERALEALPAERGRMTARTAGTIAGIEDQIARVDYWLNRTAVEPAPEVVAGQLWQERVDLLNSLWHVRWNEEVGAGFADNGRYEMMNVNEER